MNKIIYQIRKTIREKNITTLMNNSLGVVLEFDEVSKMCEIMNSNSNSNCRYEIVIVSEK